MKFAVKSSIEVWNELLFWCAFRRAVAVLGPAVSVKRLVKNGFLQETTIQALARDNLRVMRGILVLILVNTITKCLSAVTV